jgi:hypothetical protein
MKLESCHRLGLLLFSLLLMNGQTSLAEERAISVYGPPQAITVHNGNSSSAPFDGPGRFQQVYDASIFSVRLPPNPGWIRQLVFHIDPGFGRNIFTTIWDVQLNLSTTLRSPDSLSSVFDENVGQDNTMVLNDSVLVSAGPGTSVLFDLPDHRFFYDPARGNLLVDFRIYRGVESVPPSVYGAILLDGFDTMGDSVSWVYAGGNPNLRTSGQARTFGLATEIVMIPVPEPTSLVLLGGGLGALGCAWLRRTRKEITHGLV